MTGPADGPGPHDELVDALLSTVRAMVGLAARALADQDTDVTLPQYRALVVLASHGPQRVIDIAGELGVSPSAGTRMCDRLVRKKLIRRQRSTHDRREVRLSLTGTGVEFVRCVTDRRRHDVEGIVDQVPADWRGPIAQALRSLVGYTGEQPLPGDL